MTTELLHYLMDAGHLVVDSIQEAVVMREAADGNYLLTP
jgi:hypothetical protein